MKLKIAFTILLLCALKAFAVQSDWLMMFNQAGELYSKGQYDKAIAVYENLVSQKQGNAALYYNLGNAYFKTQRYGKAAAYLERAARLKPRDPDIRFNLDYVRNTVKEPAEPFPEIMVTYLNNTVSLNELTLLCWAAYFLLICGIIIRITLKRQRILLFNLICAAAAVILGGWLYVKMDREVFSREAIVISGPAEARNGPGMENSVGFTLPEGRKVSILGGNAGWSAVGLKAEGLKGWIENKCLEEI